MLAQVFRRIGSMPDLKTGNHIQKFYKLASVRTSVSGHEITLDGRSLRTPERQALCLPSYPLALAIAAEWQQQDKFLKPHTMPLMQMTATALDLKVTGLRDSLTDRVISFLTADTVCYRETKEELKKRQEQFLDPVIAHIKEKYEIELATCSGIDTPHVSETSIQNLRRTCDSFDSFEIVALETAATVSKSTSLALSLLDGLLQIQQVLRYSHIEEDYQTELCGLVEGAHDLDEAHCLMLLSAAKVLTQLKRISS